MWMKEAPFKIVVTLFTILPTIFRGHMMNITKGKKKAKVNT